MKKLTNLIIKEKVVEFEYPFLEGVTFSLGYLSKDAIEDIRKANTVTKFDTEYQMPLESLDEEGYTNEWTTKVLRGWSGLTWGKVAQMLLIEESEIEDLDEEVEFNVDNAKALMRNCTKFDNWISGKLSQLSNFRN